MTTREIGPAASRFVGDRGIHPADCRIGREGSPQPRHTLWLEQNIVVKKTDRFVRGRATPSFRCTAAPCRSAQNQGRHDEQASRSFGTKFMCVRVIGSVYDNDLSRLGDCRARLSNV